MSNIDRSSQTIILKDGRELGYAEFGNLSGKPIIYFHGHRSSRLEPRMYELESKKVDAHIFAVDRPGFGLSDFKKGYTLLDWPSDVVELADELEMEKFAILGGSGGGPFVAACAYKIPKRLTVCGIVSGLGSVKFGTEGMMRSSRMELSLGRRAPWLLKFLFWIQHRYLKRLKKKDPEHIKEIFQKNAKKTPKPDRKILGDPEKALQFFDLMEEPFRQGIKGITHEGTLFANDWGFDLKDISPDIKVFLWHGELDPSVPIRMARSVCEAIPNCTGKFYPNESHFSTAVNHIEEILTTLITH